MRWRDRIRDPVHGFVRLSERELRIINLPAFQRLRRIGQLALTNYVYPGAVHTRFEHSLGVMELATRMFHALKNNSDPSVWDDMLASCRQLNGLDEGKTLDILRLSALLHDIGHLPFSHAGEGILAEGVRHEHVSIEIIKALKTTIDTHYFNGATDLVALLIDPDRANTPAELHVIQSIIGGEIDADRCDYLRRDSLHCGVEYGSVDIDRLLQTICVVDAGDGFRLGVQRGGVHIVEGIILARYFMFLQVYMHRTRRLFDRYLNRVMQQTVAPMLTAYGNWYVTRLDDLSVWQHMLKLAQQGDDCAGRIVARGGCLDKHTVLCETNPFDGDKHIKEIQAIVDEANEDPDCDFFIDEAQGSIHRLTEPGDRPFVVVDEKRALTTPFRSHLIGSVPQKFSVVRVYGLGPEARLDPVKQGLADVVKAHELEGHSHDTGTVPERSG